MDMAKTSNRRRGLLLLAIAAVAGIAAGAVAVYVRETGNSNVASAECPGAAVRSAALEPLARGEVAAFQVAEIPRSFRDLGFNAPDGSPTTVAALSGKTLLVNLWATWCVPCRAEMPALDRLEAELGSDTFEVVAVNVDVGAEERARDFLEEIGVANLDFYADPKLATFNTLKGQGLAFGLPTTLLVDETGCGLGVMSGPAEWDSDDAKALVRAATTSN